jgi:murein DD-endopeptidase MepM/ murein hydrolase activator NlpD
VVLKSGDSLLGALVRGGLSAAEAYRDLVKLSGQIDARKLKPGDKLVLGFFSDRSRRRLATLTLSGRRGKIASVVLLPGAVGSKSLSADRGMIVKTLAVRGSPSLPRTLTELGLPPQVSEQIIMAISQSKKPPVHGEMLKIVYQVPKAPGSGSAPRLSYASYTGRDGRAHVLNYTALPTPPALQHIDVMPAALVALWDPLPGARISSPYGWRLHPVFHTRLFHKGVDYESAAGTAVIAAADGVVEDAGWRGNYGNYIRIRHSGRLETAYAHLAGFAPALEPGAPIHRGEVIGYVGMTGVATGPHLYYEVLVDGRQIDPEGSALKEATRRLTTQTARAP